MSTAERDYFEGNAPKSPADQQLDPVCAHRLDLIRQSRHLGGQLVEQRQDLRDRLLSEPKLGRQDSPELAEHRLGDDELAAAGQDGEATDASRRADELVQVMGMNPEPPAF